MRNSLIRIMVIILALSVCSCGANEKNDNFEIDKIKLSIYTSGTYSAAVFEFKNSNIKYSYGDVDEKKSIEDDDYLKKVTKSKNISLRQSEVDVIVKLSEKVDKIKECFIDGSMDDGVTAEILLNQKKYCFYLKRYDENLDNLVDEIIKVSNVKFMLSGLGYSFDSNNYK